MRYLSIILFFIIILAFRPTEPGKLEQNRCIECHGDVMKHSVMHKPVAEQCDACHTSTGEQHPMENVKGFRLENPVPALCYKCHDSLATKKYVHEPGGRGNCLRCHNAHGTEYDDLIIINPVSKLCYECHDLKTQKGDIIHNSVEEGNCQHCHDPHQSDSSHFLRSGLVELCTGCHQEQHNMMSEENIHPPFRENCLVCHKQHSSENPALTRKKMPELCRDCHDLVDEAENAKFKHTPAIDDRSCLNCHSPHASPVENMMLLETNDLCLGCHNKPIRVEARVITDMNLKIEKSKSIHPPIQLFGCAFCHNPHGAANRALLATDFPEADYINSDPKNFKLCFSCHNSTKITDSLTIKATKFRNGEQNLHFVHVKGDKGRMCDLCHDVHAAPNQHLIRERIIFGNWSMPLIYESDKIGGSCSSGCHGMRRYSRQ